MTLCASKARHRLGSKSVSWCLETSLFLRLPSWDGTPFPGRSSLPTSFVSFFIFYIFSYLFLNTIICFSGCLMSSVSIQKLFCGIYSVLKCCFDEFVREKAGSPSYSSTILEPPHGHNFSSKEEASFYFMDAVTICSGFGAPRITSLPASPVCPSICHEVMGPDAMTLVF